jgi:hypothetical protein
MVPHPHKGPFLKRLKHVDAVETCDPCHKSRIVYICYILVTRGADDFHTQYNFIARGMGLGFSHKIYEPLSGAVAKDCADICWSCVATSDYGSLRAPISERGSQARNGSDCATLIRRIAARTLNLAMCLLCAFHVPSMCPRLAGTSGDETVSSCN